MNVQVILDKIDALPPMPAVAVKLLQAAQDPDVNLAEVAGWLERDPAMTANLLKVCNSPFYGLRREVSSVRQATSLLGLKKVVQVALTVLASKYLTPSQDGYALAGGALWRNSVTAAIAAELIAVRTKYPHPSTAYTAGLLQDVGKIVLADFVGDALPRIQERSDAGAPWDTAEREIVGLPHSEVGAVLLERWGFPSLLVESVRYHHTPSEATTDPLLAQISHVADALTMSTGLGLGADGLGYRLDPNALDAVGLRSAEETLCLLAELGGQLEQARDLLGGSSPNG